jgi:hypothetical protein
MPWAGWSRAYGAYFRALCRAALTSNNGALDITFEPSKESPDTLIVVADRSLLDANGGGPIRNVDVDTSAFWRATALLLALILATPVSWKRRAWALLWGLAAMHCILLLSMGFLIWNESTYLSAKMHPLFRKGLAEGLGQTVLAQFSVAVPALLWILVTFRNGDEWLFGKRRVKDAVSRSES